MIAVSAGELAMLRADLESAFFTEEAEIQRPVKSTDGRGSMLTDWDVIATVACNRKPTSDPASRGAGNEGDTGSRMSAESYWVFTVPAGTDVQTKDRIVESGRTYEVTSAPLDRATEIARYVVAVEMS